MSNTIDENGKLVFLENHFYTAKLEKRYEQFFLNYDNYNSSWNHYEDDKIIVDFYYATICSNFLQFVFVDKEKRIQEDTVLNFNKELVSLLKSTDIKILKGEWLDEANMLYIYDLPIK